METNLGSIIKEIVQNQKFERLQQIYIVGTRQATQTNKPDLIDAFKRPSTKPSPDRSLKSAKGSMMKS